MQKIIPPEEACCCSPCCPGWVAPTTLTVTINTDCAALNRITFTLTGAGGSSRSWGTGSNPVDFGCGEYWFGLSCNPDDEAGFPWRLNGGINYPGIIWDCYTGLFGEGFEMIQTAPDSCDPFQISFFELISGLACSYESTTFVVTE